MKIKRTINGGELVITLSNKELNDAYREQKRILEAEKEREKTVLVADLKAGEIFSKGGREFIVLNQESGKTRICLKGYYGEDMEFDAGNCPDYKSSDLKEYCDTEVYEEFAGIFGEDNIFYEEVDFTTMDGQKKYGICNCRVRPLTFDEWRKYNQYLPKEVFNEWYWLCTPWSILDKDWGHNVAVCGVTGNLNSYTALNSGRCAPACVISSSVKGYKNGELPFLDETEQAIQTVEDMAEYLPNGLIRDADTVLVDIIKAADFEFNGFAQDIFNIWRKSSDRKSVEQMFFEFTDCEFLDYLKKCPKIMQAVHMADAVGKWLKDKGIKDDLDFSALIDNLSNALEFWSQTDIKENRAEFFGQMIDQVETYLEDCGYEQDDIPSDDRNQTIADGEDLDTLALIYGEDYDFLSTKFAEILKM